MVDAEISVLITAVDNMSVTLKNIEENVKNTANNTQKATESLGNSFQTTTTNLLALGNVAQTASNIFESYENTQIRVENAEDRMLNATDRLSNAQAHLREVLANSKSSVEEIANAQNDVERSSRSLEISQRNLERANVAVYVSYVNIAVQTGVLLKSLPELTKTITALRDANIALEFALGPVGIALGLAAIAIGIVTEQNKELKQSQDDAANSTSKFTAELQNQIDFVNKFYNQNADNIKATTQDERNAKKEITDQEEKVRQIKENNLKGNSDLNKLITTHSLEYEEAALKTLKDKYQIYYAEKRNIALDAADNEKDDILTNLEDSQSQQLTKIHTFSVAAINEYQKVVDIQNEIAGFGGPPTINFNTGMGSSAHSTPNPFQPGQYFSPTPSISLPGTSSSTNVSIGAVYGLSAENVSRALKNELATKINI